MHKLRCKTRRTSDGRWYLEVVRGAGDVETGDVMTRLGIFLRPRSDNVQIFDTREALRCLVLAYNRENAPAYKIVGGLH